MASRNKAIQNTDIYMLFVYIIITKDKSVSIHFPTAVLKNALMVNAVYHLSFVSEQNGDNEVLPLFCLSLTLSYWANRPGNEGRRQRITGLVVHVLVVGL